MGDGAKINYDAIMTAQNSSCYDLSMKMWGGES